MRFLLLAIGACMLLAGPSVAQTVTDVGQNFSRTGRPGEWAGQGVNLSLKFDETGQICEAVWPSEQFVDNAILVGQSSVSEDQLKSILNLLAPREVRGNPVGPLWGVGMMGGGSGRSEYEYENLKVTGFYAVPLEFRSPARTEKVPESVPKEIEPAGGYFERQMANEVFSSASVVRIRWKNRCGQK